MCVTESVEDRIPSPHDLDEVLLAFYTIQIVTRLGFPDEIQALLGRAPHLVKVISSREKVGDGVVAAVTGEDNVARFDSSGEGIPDKVECGGDRLRPNSNPCHIHVDLRLVGGKSMFLGEIDTELSKTVGIGVAVKGPPEDVPERRIAMRGSIGSPVLQTQGYDKPGSQQEQILIGEKRNLVETRKDARRDLNFRVGHRRQVDKALDGSRAQGPPDFLVFIVNLFPGGMVRHLDAEYAQAFERIAYCFVI